MLHGVEVGGDQPNFAIGAIEILESVAQLGVHGVEVVNLDTLAVGWIGDDDGAALWWFLILEAAIVEHYVFVELAVLEILLALFENVHIDIVTPNFVFEVKAADLAIFGFFNTLPNTQIKFFPTTEAEIATTIVLSGDIVGHHGCLNEKSTRTAHGIHEVAITLPARKLDHTSSEHLVDGSNTDGLTVATLVERVARGVEQKSDMIINDVEVELVFGSLGVDGGALAEFVAETVDNSIFSFKGSVVGMSEIGSAGRRIDHKSTIDIENLFPMNLIDFLVKFAVVVGIEFGERFENGQCCAASVVGTIEHLHVAGEGDGTSEDLNVIGATFAKFVGEDFFKAEHSLGHHLEGGSIGFLDGDDFTPLLLDDHR